jgi:protein-tyrosine-phosphatase
LPSILFVCSANRFRSVIAAEQFRRLLIARSSAEYWQVESAGTWADPNLPPIAQAIQFSKKRGWNIEGHRSREVNTAILENADLILAMTHSQLEAMGLEFSISKGKIALLSQACEHQSYDISDPMENADSDWNAVGSEICSLIDRGFYRICRMALKNATNR